MLLPPCKLEHPKLLQVLRDIGIAISVQLTIFLNLLAHITVHVVTNSVMYHIMLKISQEPIDFLLHGCSLARPGQARIGKGPSHAAHYLLTPQPCR